MVALLEGTFFSDRIRGAITIFLLVLLVGLFGVQYFFPRHTNTLDVETIDALRDVKGQLERVVDNLEKSSESQAALNQTLTRQLDSAKKAQDEGYADLLKELGLDLTLPSVGADDPFGLRTQDNHLGRKLVPSGSGTAGADKLLPGPSSIHQSPIDPGDSTGSRTEPGPTTGFTGGSYYLPRTERLHLAFNGG